MDRAEVIALRWSQIDEAQETCWCPRHKTGQARVLPLNIVHLGILKRAKRVRSIADGGHVFLGAEGKPLTADTVRCALRRAYAKAKLDIPAPFKTLRHTFGARLAMRGVPMRAIAELMGHSTQAVTERYAHLSPEYLREAMGALEWHRFGTQNPRNGETRTTDDTAQPSDTS
jgi:integrase